MSRSGNFIVVVVAALFAQSLAVASHAQSAAKASNHAATAAGTPGFDGTRFYQPEPRKFRFGAWAKKTFVTRRGPWRAFTNTPPGPAPAAGICDGDLRVTFVNHATLLIQMDGVNILTDPTWAERSVATVGARRRRPPGIRFEDLPRIDAVLVSHDHQDHMDLPTLRRLAAAFHPVVYTGLRNGVFLAKNGVARGHDLDWWQSAELGHGVTITAVPARHSSGRGLFGHDRTLWCGFVVSGPSGSVYFAGDTGWGSHFAAIGKRFPDLRLAILPIGGFKPVSFMREQHIGPEDALQAMRDLGAHTMIPMHFGTFPNSDDGETEPVEVLVDALALSPDLRGRVVILDNGQSADISPVRRPEPQLQAKDTGSGLDFSVPTTSAAASHPGN
jgi:L-ascorbate metabolism protein UlaG (beta-lactamase superfamily)